MSQVNLLPKFEDLLTDTILHHDARDTHCCELHSDITYEDCMDQCCYQLCLCRNYEETCLHNDNMDTHQCNGTRYSSDTPPWFIDYACVMISFVSFLFLTTDVLQDVFLQWSLTDCVESVITVNVWERIHYRFRISMNVFSWKRINRNSESDESLEQSRLWSSWG